MTNVFIYYCGNTELEGDYEIPLLHLLFSRQNYIEMISEHLIFFFPVLYLLIFLSPLFVFSTFAKYLEASEILALEDPLA